MCPMRTLARMAPGQKIATSLAEQETQKQDTHEGSLSHNLPQARQSAVINRSYRSALERYFLALPVDGQDAADNGHPDHADC